MNKTVALSSKLNTNLNQNFFSEHEKHWFDRHVIIYNLLKAKNVN